MPAARQPADMAGIPGDLDTDRGPPLAVPLAHFLVGLAFLLVGALVGAAPSSVPGLAGLAHVHLLLVGWVCVTILGAMTQFVPVWSGVALHGRRLATAQLWLLATGVAGFAGALLAGALAWLAVPGTLMLAGLLVFAYNLARTLGSARPWDVTERHFAIALCFFALLAPLGLLLAAGYAVSLPLPVARPALVATHATLAVFGAVLTTVLGALYQLATMFTQSDLHGVDRPLRAVEEVGYPAGVVALAAGRLLGDATLARVGGLLLAAGLAAFAVVLLRRLAEASVDRTPMLTRYAVVACVAAVWAPVAAGTWLVDPLGRAALLGPPGLAHLLLVGVVGFVVVGTLYHVVPFLVWVHRYSDRLGLEPVPSIDDLYDDRLAAVDFWALLGAAVALVLAAAGLAPPGVPPASLRVAGGALALVGVATFAANMLLVVGRHGPGAATALLARG